MQRRTILDSVTSVALLAAAVVVLWVNGPRLFVAKTEGLPKVAMPKEPLDLGGRALHGNSSADTVLIEFADVQCPFCAAFSRQTMPEIETRYVSTGKLLVGFVHVPLSIHPFALRAAQSLECADSQGAFWTLLPLLFDSPGSQLSDIVVRDSAQRLGLNLAVFDLCLQQPPSEKIEKDRKMAEALGVKGTPFFVIGRRLSDGRVRATALIDGARPTPEFTRILDAATAK